MEISSILIVDDNEINRDICALNLEHMHVPLHFAENGRDGLKIAREIVPDLILLDVMMPVMDGYQTAREIRKQPRFYDLPIIALTAKALKEDRHKCIAAGANDYLSKPVDVERLFSTLRVWLYRRECIL